MNAARHPLYAAKTLLEGIAARRDYGRLEECLAGRHLPALGGEQHPADTLYQGLTLPPFRPEQATVLADLTARVSARRREWLEQQLSREAASDLKTRLAVSGGHFHLSQNDEYLLFNLFLFASYLPPAEPLFEALKQFYFTGLQVPALLGGHGRVERQLRQALIYQQVDASLEDTWFGVFESAPRRGGAWPEEERQQLLDAWRGLLWIPPSAEERSRGESLCIQRVERGLLALSEAVDQSSNGVRVLRRALRLLNDAYPRSPQFWFDQFSPHIGAWPQLPRDVAEAQWPGLSVDGRGLVEEIPSDAHAAWGLLEPSEVSAIETACAEPNARTWKTLWGRLLFEAPRGGLSRQDWGRQLNTIKHALEQARPDLQRARAAAAPMRADAVTPAKARNKHKRGKGKGIDRMAAYDRVNKVVDEIDHLLADGQLERAREYQANLEAQQEKEGTEPTFIAKTLCNIATSARDHGAYPWAEELYRRAQVIDPADPVAHTGLAEILRARDRLDDAEALYRETMTRWPNNVVVRNGLAETLRARDRLDEAEALYRETMTRWPRDRVAIHGLANALRKQRRFDEALALVPEPNNLRAQHDQYDLHLRGMVMLEAGRVEEATAVFRRALDSNTLARRQRQIFLSALALAQLRQEQYEGAWGSLEAVEDLGPTVIVLRLHAAAGTGDPSRVRDVGSGLDSGVVVLLKPVRKALDSIQSGYCLDSNGPNICRPTEAQRQTIFSNEADMLLAA